MTASVIENEKGSRGEGKKNENNKRKIVKKNVYVQQGKGGRDGLGKKSKKKK